jgi:ribosomal protein S18 acetylase RimI-like enzyme
MRGSPTRARTVATAGTASALCIVEATHVERVAALHLQSWRHTYRGILPDDFLDGEILPRRLRAWRTHMGQNRADRLLALAELASQLVGFICVHGDADRDWGSRIESLHVAVAFKRRGAGRALMRHAALWLQARYPRRGVYLWVVARNAPARRFYEHLGAESVGASERRDASGGSAANCRYVWRDPAALLRGCQSG